MSVTINAITIPTLIDCINNVEVSIKESETCDSKCLELMQKYKDKLIGEVNAKTR